MRIRVRRWANIDKSAFVVMFQRHEQIRNIIRIGAYEHMTLFEDEVLADRILDDITIHRGFVTDLEHHMIMLTCTLLI